MQRYMIMLTIIICSMILGGCTAPLSALDSTPDSPMHNSRDNSTMNTSSLDNQRLIFNPPAVAKEALLTIPGHTSPGNKIYINGEEQKVNPDGSFTTVILLTEGLNTILIKEISPNARLQKSRRVEYIPEIPAPELWVQLEDRKSVV